MHATLFVVSEIVPNNFKPNMLADFNTLMRLESDIIEKRLSSSVPERIDLSPSNNTGPHPSTHRIYKVDKGTGMAQEITLRTEKPVTSTVLIGANVTSIQKDLEADQTPELDPKMGRLWTLYQSAKVEYTSCLKGSFAHSKAARFLRDTIENGLTYIERAYPSVVCDSNSETARDGANLLGARTKVMELRTSLNEITPVVEKAYGSQRRRFGGELFQHMAHAIEEKQRVPLHHQSRDMNTDRASESHRGADRNPVPRYSEVIPQTIRESRRSRSPPRPRPVARRQLRSRSRSPRSSRFPPRTRSPLSSPGLYDNGHAASRNVRAFERENLSWRGRLTARYASFPQEKDRYRPSY